jgi:HK97 gp10 family phage protein
MAEFVKITGLDKTVAALRALPREISGKNGGPMRGALFAAARAMRDEAIRLAPEDTGNLKRNIFAYRDRNPAMVGANEHYIVAVRTGRLTKRIKRAYRLGRISPRLRAVGGGDAWYGLFVEFGTARMSAKPYLRPAFESRKNDVVGIFSRELAKGVDRAVARAKTKGGF